MNRPSRTLSALVILALVGFAAQASAGALEDARKLADAKKYEQALALIENTLKENPKEPRARFMKGVILAENRQGADAIVVFQELTQDYRDLPEPYNNLAVLYAEQGDFDHAREALMQAIRTHPSYATAHENLGDIYARLASEAYIKALQINRGNSITQTKLDMIREIFNTPVGAKGKGTVVAQARTTTVEIPASPEAPPPAKTAVVEPPVEEKSEAVKAPPPKGELPKVEPIKADLPKVEPPQPEPTKNEPPKEVPLKKEPPKTEPPRMEPPRMEPVKTEPPKGTEKSTLLAAAQEEQQSRHSVEAAKLVLEWSKAWSSRDATTYLNFYAKEFSPPRGIKRDDWERERKSRITRPKFIQVNISNIRTVPSAGDTVEVRFLQEYKSDYYQSRTNKALQLKREGNRWKIIQELAMDG